MGMVFRRGTTLTLLWVVVLAFPFWAGEASSAPRSPSSEAALPLGPRGLLEERSEDVLQPGVTLTTISRGEADPNDFWTVEVNIPAGSTSPDPDAPPAALSDRTSAE